MPKLLIIQHEKDSPPGTTLFWAKQRGFDIHIWWPAQEKTPPEISDFAGVVICGGSMDTFEEDKHPWLVTEKRVVRELIETGKKVFGLCLGSQLLAEALGARVYQHPGWEIGFVPVRLLDGSTLSAFHWHRYTFDLPVGAELLAEGSFCRNQAFKFGSNIIATQFHPESTEEWIRQCATEIEARHQGNVQPADKILESMPLQKTMQSWYFAQLDLLF